MFHVPLQIILLRLLYSEFAETCDQPKRDRAASQSQRAEKPVPASHACSGQSEPKGRGHWEASNPQVWPERLLDHTLFKVGSLQETRDCRQAGLLSHRAAGARDSGTGTQAAGSFLSHFPGAGQQAPLSHARPRSLQGCAGTLTESLEGLPVLCPGKLCGSNWESG